MPAHQSYLAFNSGELSPYLRHRTDFDKHASGVEIMENFLPMPFGGVRKRPGLQWMATLESPDTRLEIFNDSYPYMLAFTETSLRIYGPYAFQPFTLYAEISWEFGDPFALQFVKLNDVVFIAKAGLAPLRLSLTDLPASPGAWVLEELPFSWQPFLDVNEKETATMTVAPPAGSAAWATSTAYTTGTRVTAGGKFWDCITAHTSNSDRQPGTGKNYADYWRAAYIRKGDSGVLTGSAEVFFDTTAHIGAVYEISQRREQSQFETRLKLLVSTDQECSPELAVTGRWSLKTYGTWDGWVYLERSADNGLTWEVYRSWRSVSDANFDVSGEEDSRVLMRIRYDYLASGSGTDAQRAILTSEEPYLTGRLKITSFTDAHTAVFEALDDMDLGTTDYWREGAFSAFQGYPAAIAIHERRLVFGGTRRQPVSLWLSRTDDLLHFRPGSTEDDASIFVTLAATQQYPVCWIASQRRMLVGTTGGEWVFGSETSDSPLSPSNLLARQYTFFGSAPLPAITMHSGVFFIERQGRRLREMAYLLDQESYDAADLTRLAEHITASGITQMAWQSTREPCLWAVTRDGMLLNFTYIRTEKVAAWSRHTTRSTADRDYIRSVAVMRGSQGDDTVFVVVNRPTGTTIEAIPAGEQLAQERTADGADYMELEGLFYLDGGVRQNPAAGVIQTPPHLDGIELTVYVDGYTSKGTPENGQLEVSVGNSQIASVGFPIESRLVTLPPDMQTESGGSHGRQKRASEVKLSLFQSNGGAIVYEGASRDISVHDATEDLSAPQQLFSGWTKTTLGPGYSEDLQFEIRHNTPHPFTVVAATLTWALSEP